MRQLQITVYLPPDILRSLDEEAVRRTLAKAGTSEAVAVGRRSAVVRDALLAYLPAAKPTPLASDVDEVLG